LPRDIPKNIRRHEPEKTALYQIVRENLNAFFDRADARAGEGRGLPRYVKNAFYRYLECGILAHGFARVRCPDCGYDMVVAFSTWFKSGLQTRLPSVPRGRFSRDAGMECEENILHPSHSTHWSSKRL
jgi:hypothetical protein